MLVTASFSAAAQTETRSIQFAANKCSIAIPAVMDTMPADKILIKYNKQPDAKSRYYANADYSFSMVMDEIAAEITEDMLEPLKPQLLQQLGKQNFSENKMITVSGHKLIVVAYNAAVPGGQLFNRRIFFVADKKLYSVAFNTTITDLPKRKGQIESSIHSLRIR